MANEDFISDRESTSLYIEVAGKSGSWTFISCAGSGKSDSVSFRTYSEDISFVCKGGNTIAGEVRSMAVVGFEAYRKNKRFFKYYFAMKKLKKA